MTSAARTVGAVPQIGAWAGFCSNDTVSGRGGESDPHPSHFTTFLLSFQHETTAAHSDGVWGVPWECGGECHSVELSVTINPEKG